MSRFSAAMVSAMSRVAIRPEAQAGAPGQAAILVRGSAASVTKPRVAAVCWSERQAVGERPIKTSARPGARRISVAPRVKARCVSSTSFCAGMLPKGRPMPRAMPSVRSKTPMGKLAGTGRRSTAPPSVLPEGGAKRCQLARDLNCRSVKSLAWASRPFSATIRRIATAILRAASSSTMTSSVAV